MMRKRIRRRERERENSSYAVDKGISEKVKTVRNRLMWLDFHLRP